MKEIIIDFGSWFYKNCKRQRKNKAKICQVCPFRDIVEKQERRRLRWTLGVLSATGKNEEIIFTVIGVKKKSRRKKKELRKNGKEVYLNGGQNE